MVTAPTHVVVPSLRHLLVVGPHAGAHRVALRLAVSALIPLLVLWRLGRVDLAPYAFLPTTVAVFGRHATSRGRLVMQTQVGGVIVALVLAGAVASSAGVPAWAIVGLTGLVAAGCSIAADMLKWTPVGSLFFVFAFVVSASSPVGRPELPIIVGITIAAGVLTALVTATGLLPVPSSRRPRRSAPGAPATVPRRNVVAAHGVASFVAIIAAGTITLAQGSQHPYWAMVSAIVPIAGVTTVGQLTRAAHRIIGTVLGLAATAMVLAVATTPLALVIALVLCIMATELLVARNYALAMLFITPATIGMIALNNPQPLAPLLAARVAETCIGVAVAFVVIVATHAVRHPVPRDDESSRHPLVHNQSTTPLES
nr:FUSC family protein [Rhodococcus wratislaviensis]GLK40039.1 FUSC family protein [Rhodococcus wratislaviensis]